MGLIKSSFAVWNSFFFGVCLLLNNYLYLFTINPFMCMYCTYILGHRRAVGCKLQRQTEASKGKVGNLQLEGQFPPLLPIIHPVPSGVFWLINYVYETSRSWPLLLLGLCQMTFFSLFPNRSWYIRWYVQCVEVKAHRRSHTPPPRPLWWRVW